MVKIFDKIKQINTFYFKPFLTKGSAFSKAIMIFLVRVYFKFDIIIMYFFSSTLVGYCIYLFCFLYGFFGCLQIEGTCDMSNFYAAFFASFVLSITLQIFILLKIPSSRKFIELVVGKNFIESYLGVHSGTAAATMATKIATPILGAAFAEITTSYYNELAQHRTAAQIRQDYFNDLDKAGEKLNMNSKEYKAMKKMTDSIYQRPTHGVITQGINNEYFQHRISSFSSTVKSVFTGK